MTLPRYFLTSLCFIVFINCSFCQNEGRYSKDSIALGKIGEMQIALDTNERFGGERAFPFRSIRIADVRFDTTHIGIYASFSRIFIPTIKNYKINCKNGAGSSLSIYFNKYFEKNLGSGDIELVCFLKRLSVVKRDTLIDNVSLTRTYGQVNFTTEVFLRSGNEFYAVFKIDTVLIESIGLKKKEIVDEIKEYLLVPAMKIMQKKISGTSWDKIMKKKSFSESVVYGNYFNNRFNLPILTQPHKKGIYKSFSEFKNNAPSVSDFKVKKGKSGSVSLTDEEGNYVATIKMFGFSDGKRCWILKGDFCYPLIRTGNSFEFFVTIPYNLKILFAIDMEMGDIR